MQKWNMQSLFRDALRILIGWTPVTYGRAAAVLCLSGSISYAFVAATFPTTSDEQTREAKKSVSADAEKQVDKESAEFMAALKSMTAVAVPAHPVFDVAEYKKQFLSTTASTRLLVVSDAASAADDAAAVVATCRASGATCMQIVIGVDSLEPAQPVSTDGTEPIRQFAVSAANLPKGSNTLRGAYVLFPGNVLAWRSSTPDVKAVAPIVSGVLTALRKAESGRQDASAGSQQAATPLTSAPAVVPKAGRKTTSPLAIQPISDLRRLRGQVRSAARRGGPFVALPDTGAVGDAMAVKRPLVVVFWGTWCIPCRNEMPKLADLLQRYSGAAVVGVLVEETTTSPTKLTSELKKLTAGTRLTTNYVARDRELLSEIFADKEAAVPSFAVFAASGELKGQVQGTISDVANYNNLNEALRSVTRDGPSR